MDPKDPEDIKKFMRLYKDNPGVDIKKIIVFGLLANQKMSGYDLYKVIEHKANVLGSMMKAGKQSVYNTLKRMEDAGDAEIAEVVTDTNRPTKTLYCLTDQGKNKLNEMVRQEMRRPPVIFNNVAGVLGISKNLPKEELRAIVVEKIEQLEYMVKVEEGYCYSSPGPLYIVLAESKVKATKALLETMTNALEVIDNNDYKDLFTWPDLKKDELWKKVIEDEEGG
jgi:DNA-binding PadR family transcriptional regulator